MVCQSGMCILPPTFDENGRPSRGCPQQEQQQQQGGQQQQQQQQQQPAFRYTRAGCADASIQSRADWYSFSRFLV